MPLFEVAIIQIQTKKEAEDGVGGEKLLYGPKCLIAKDGPTAGMIAMRSTDVPADLDLNKAQVLVRPFA